MKLAFLPFVSFLAWILPVAGLPAQTQFVNPIAEGADPWMTRQGDAYYFCQALADRSIAIWRSDSPVDKGIMRVVWQPPADGWNKAMTWAPELHFVQGRWYIYYAASDGVNETHRMGVLRAKTPDPQGGYDDMGMLYTGDQIETGAGNRWAIDGTVLSHRDRLYFIWSGWQDERDIQYLYIAAMANPWTIASNRVNLCDNDTYLWERVDESTSGRGLQEGPEILKKGNKILLTYSCSGSWQSSYKLGLLWMSENNDPLNPLSWQKLDKPLLTGAAAVRGVGHASFVTSPDNTQDWIIYHTKVSDQPGWQRVVMAQKFGWTKEGFPRFDFPSQPGRSQTLPAGCVPVVKTGTFRARFEEEHWDAWRYWGHHALIAVRDGTLHLGDTRMPRVNFFQTGEKVLVRNYRWQDAAYSVRVQVKEGNRDAGILFRASEPAVGYDAVKGYFAGIIPGANRLVLGKMDGNRWRELARAELAVEPAVWYDLSVKTQGDAIDVALNGDLKIRVRDDQYPEGMAGLRVVDSYALFDDFIVTGN